MSIEEQDAVIGRVARELKETERKLAALLSEAARIGDVLSSVAAKLKHYPETIIFERQSGPAELVSGRREPVFKPEDVDANRLMNLTTEIRNTLDKLSRLKSEANSLGI